MSEMLGAWWLPHGSSASTHSHPHGKRQQSAAGRVNRRLVEPLAWGTASLASVVEVTAVGSARSDGVCEVGSSLLRIQRRGLVFIDMVVEAREPAAVVGRSPAEPSRRH